MFARQPSSARLSLPFPVNSMGLAQRARRCETDAHGRAQSRHAAQHGDISARRQTVRIQSSDPTCKESASYLSFFCGVRRGRDTRGRLPIPDSDILAPLPERVCKKRQMLESSGKESVSKASRRLSRNRWKTLEAEERPRAS